jgi:O-antigen/teichoic acid export membrane protein
MKSTYSPHASTAVENDPHGDGAVLVPCCQQSLLKCGETTSTLITRSAGIAMAGGLVSQGLKFLVILYVARHFSVSEFGLLSFAIAVNAYMFVISNFGLNVFGSRAIAQAGVVPGALLAEVCCLEIVLASAGLVVALGALSFVPGIGHLELRLIALFGLSNVIQAALFDWVFQGLHRQEVSAGLNILWQGTWLSLTIAGVGLGLGVLAVPAALCTSALLASIVGYCWIRSTVRVESTFGQSLHLLRRCWQTLRSAAPLGWGTLLMTLIIWSDTVAVRLIKGEQAVGWYAAGNRAALALAMLSGFYVQGALPSLSRASGESPAQYSLLFQHCYQDMARLFVPVCLWAMVYAREIVLLLFRRSEFLAAVPVFRVFQMMTLFAAIGNLYGIGGLVALHRDRDYQRVLFLTAAVFLPLCAVLTSYYGILGASVAALLGQSFGLYLFTGKTRGLLQVNHRAALVVPVGAGLCVAAVGKFTGLGLVGSGAVLVLTNCALFGGRIWSRRPPQGAWAQ